MDHGEQKYQGAREIERISFDTRADPLEDWETTIAIALQIGREVERGTVTRPRRGCSRKAAKQYG
jgi:hypothetical protein